ncbi:MAG: PD-(D/E)XK nuclease family protein [Bacteroidales bacterium]|jgi:hypothetical protein|nr:PD-(D/E)XK nuclease family protein [Bacteroidales bacterium]
MIPFLKEVASQIFDEQSNNLQDVHALVPNRRAILYLKRYLSGLSDKPLWSPKMYSIEDFVFEATGLQKCDTVDLIFELYAIHRNIADQDARSFDYFAQWGEQLLKDFNDIDFYLADAKKLFSYLSEAKAIERWHIDGGELTESEKKYLEFYNSLATYYNMLREKMILKEKAWQGLAYRLFTEKFDHYFEKFSNKPFYIVGFNALTKAEEEIFKNIQRNAPTKILWDADEYYVNNLRHEAGHFLREYRKKFGKNFHLQQNFKSEKNISIVGISKNIGQAIEAGKILSEIADDTEAPDNTAIILNNEEELFPTLGFIPEKYEKFNITMGYPLRLTQLFSFFVKWIDLHLSTENDRANRFRFERNLFFDFLRHPVLQNYIQTDFFNKTSVLDKNIEEQYHKANAFVSPADIEIAIFKDLEELFSALSFIFESWDNSFEKAASKLQEMIVFLYGNYVAKDDAINLEILLQLNNATNRLKEIGKKYSDGISMQSILFIFNRILQSVKIPFTGEPVSGLQVMGMLETRLLDYKNIILLSVNEGIIPSEGRNSTFIPFDIRRHFQLPTKAENNAVSSYHFYRLLQRAENIHIIYNAEPDSGVSSGKEQSRFVTQLLQELPRYNPNIRITSKIENITPTISKKERRFSIEKTKFAMKRLDEMAEKGFSASSINDYLSCPVDFYLKWLAKVPEVSEYQSGVDAKTFGTVIHAVIQKTHQHLLNKPLCPDDIDPVFSTYKDELEKQFTKHWQGGDFKRGENFLILISAQDYLNAFLKKERQEIREANEAGLSYEIIGQELLVSDHLTIKTFSGEKLICIKGFIDRIVKIGNTIKIMDFKTGQVKNGEVNLKDINVLIEKKSYPKAIQVLIYTWLMRRNNKIPSNYNVEAGLFSFRRIQDGFLPLKINDTVLFDENQFIVTEQILKDTLEEIYNPKIPFTFSEKEDAHQYSQFKLLYR